MLLVGEGGASLALVEQKTAVHIFMVRLLIGLSIGER